MRCHGRQFGWNVLATLVLFAVTLALEPVGAEPARGPLEMMDDAALTDVFFFDLDHGWAVGDRGVILHTSDGGRHWQPQRAPTTSRLESVHFIDGQRGWAVGGWVHPYTQRTSCVVLSTQNGGRDWTLLPGLTLPALKQVRFHDAGRGWAVGNASALYPTGIFRTEDGGRSWTPLPAGMTGKWTAADFRDMRRGIAVGHDGHLATISAPKVRVSKTPSVGLRPLRAVRLLDDRHGWLVGDGGLVMQTSDAGLTWQTPAGPLPPGVVDLFDYRALAVFEAEIWVAGAPGSCVLHSADGGRMWELLRTDQNVPIRAMTFIDSQRGWAVGELGTILATRDGGRTWRRQRTGGTRIALLGLFSEPTRIPLELYAMQSGEEGYLGYAEILNRRDVEIPLTADAPTEDRAAAAMSAVGASGADHSWRFPLRQSGLQLSSVELVETWDRANDGRAIALLDELIVRKIRQWRPEVIVTEPASPRGDRPLAHVINQIVLAAVHNAADSTAHPAHATVAGLQPWTVKKVFSLAASDDSPTFSLTTARIAARLGKSVADQATDGYAMIHDRYTRIPLTAGFRLLLDELPQSVGRKDVFSGIFLQAGGEARRRASPLGSRNIEALTRVAQKRRNIEQIFDQTAGSAGNIEAWLGGVHKLTKGMSGSSAGQVLYQLGQRYRDAGRLDLAAQSFEQLVERYPDHALSESALIWLIQYYSSGEIGWQLRRQTEFVAQRAGATVTDTQTVDTVRQAGLEQPLSEPTQFGTVRTRFQTSGVTSNASIGMGATDRAAKALWYAKMIQRGRPELFAEPWVQFPLSVAYRTKGMPRDAERFYHRISSSPIPSQWARCAQAELWLLHRRGVTPKTTYACRMGKTRPRLDGDLQDAIWQRAAQLELSSAQHDDDAWPAAAMLSYDDQFLYLVVSCRKAPEREYPETPGPRPRDPDLTAHDRVDFFIDLDRDYTTFYRLTVDHRGWTGEACAGNVHWNPTWYVACETTDDEWTIEAAIPLGELTPQRPRPGDVWAIGVQRVVPGVGIQAFTQPASVTPRAEGFALMVFQ